MNVLFQIRPRLIIIFFPVDKLWVFHLMRPTRPGLWIHSKEKVFLFFQCSLCGMTLESGFLLYPKLCVFALQWTNSNCLFSAVWRMITCWLFGGLFLCTIHGCCLPLSADAFMANSEWDSLMNMSPNAIEESWKTVFPLPLFLVTTIVGKWPVCRTSFLHNPRECMRVSYSLVTMATFSYFLLTEFQCCRVW